LEAGLYFNIWDPKPMKFRYNFVIICLVMALFNLYRGSIKMALGNIVGIPIVLALAKLLDLIFEGRRRSI
jgi:hypothetical protein